jgi:translocation and assembly module TamA
VTDPLKNSKGAQIAIKTTNPTQYYSFYYLFLIVLALLCLGISPATFAANNLTIEITGVNADAAANIQARLAIDQEAYGPTLTTQQLQTFYDHAPTTIRSALEPYGYFKASVTSQHTPYNPKMNKVHFYIQPGLPILITKIELQIIGPGEDNTAIQQFVRQFPLKVGDVFNTERYEKAKSTLFDITNNQGYLKAVLDKKEIRINLNNRSAIIILRMNTGSQYYFGPFTFSQSPFNDAFLHRFVPFKEDEPFSSEKLLKFQQDLNNSKYFRQVTVSPLLDRTENQSVPTQIDLTAPRAQLYNLGLGYGTYTGPRVTLGVDFRRVTDTGQHFNAQVKYSSVLKGLATKYFIPGYNPLTEQYTLGANIQEFIPKNGKSFSETLSASYVKTINHWTNTFSLNLLNERYFENNDPTKKSHLLYPSYNLANITADDIIKPRQGNAFNFTLQGSTEELFSTTSFIQSEIKDKFIFSPTEFSRIILRGDLGYTVVNDLKQLPLTLNYFAGGLNSVRGYDYGSLGPGRYLQIASAEIQHRIYGNWNGAIFYDIGNAVDHFNDPLMSGVGFGIIYQSVIGAIQVYIARAESKRDKPLSLEFTIGPDF